MFKFGGFVVQISDAVVIGGGVVGCSCAYHLAREGVTTLLLERDRIGAHASGGAAGMLLPLAEARGRSSFFSLCRESLQMFSALSQNLMEESGVDIELIRSGTIYTSDSESRTAELQSWMETAQSADLRVEWLSAGHLHAIEPSISTEVAGALLSCDEFQVRSPQLTRAFSLAATGLGAEIREGAEAVQIETETGGCRIFTHNEVISCGSVVIASGPWASAILCDVEVPAVHPIKGQLVTLRPRKRTLRRTIYSSNGYLVPKNDGTIIVGATEEHTGFDREPTAKGCNELLEVAREIVPSMSESEVIGAWGGLRPVTADRLPMIGRLPGSDRVMIAGGHHRNGVLLSPVTGKMIADLVIGRNEPPEGFRPARFIT